MENKYEKLSEEMADYWNTRIIKHTVKYLDKTETWYGVHEVYYYKDGRPAMWTEEPIRLHFYEAEDFEDKIKQISDAKERTVLEEIDGKIIDTNKLIGEMN